MPTYPLTPILPSFNLSWYKGLATCTLVAIPLELLMTPMMTVGVPLFFAKFVHTAVGIYLSFYPFVFDSTYDAVFLVISFLVILHWYICGHKCILHLLEQHVAKSTLAYSKYDHIFIAIVRSFATLSIIIVILRSSMRPWIQSLLLFAAILLERVSNVIDSRL
jgi:hypothetical protein